MVFDFISGYVLGARNVTRAAGMAASAAQFHAQPQSKLLDLTDRLDRMTLVMEAMWSLLHEQGFTNDQLIARIEELDAADGAVDGRKITPAADCPECGAKVGRGIGHCQFCGYEIDDPSPFAS